MDPDIADDSQIKNVKNLLDSWDLGNLFEFLTSENVTVKVLKILNLDQLEELTSTWKIGDKVLFSFHLQKWREQLQIPVHPGKFCDKLSAPKTSISYGESSYSSEIEGLPNALDILKSDKMGCRVLDSYKIGNVLTEDQRNLVINIIAKYFDNNNQHLSLQLSHKLEDNILSIFPTEKKEFYRTERRGKLYVKYCNMKKTSKQIFGKEIEQPSSSKASQLNFVPEEGAEIMAQSLKYDNLSAEDFNSTWSACYNYRLNQIFEKCENLGEILKIWPQYKTPNGFKLIDKDFTTLYSSYDSILSWGHEKFVQLYNGLTQLKNGKCLGIIELMEHMSADDANKDPDMFALKVLWVLHYFLSPTGRHVRKNVMGKKEISRFSTKDSQESLLFLGNTMQELQDHVQFILKRGESIQPFILAIGNLEKAEQFFVYLDGTLLPFSNFHRSLDICFKIFHLFHLEYPKASESVWYFIEHYLYSLNTKSKKNSKVSILLDELQKRKQQFV